MRLGRSVYEEFLRVDGWRSEYPSVNKTLRHYRRRVQSESTRMNLLQNLTLFCRHCGLGPEEVVDLTPGEVSEWIQGYGDSLMERGCSLRYINSSLAYLKTHFKVNGFKGDRLLEVERYHQPTRYRKKAVYIPSSDEIHRMAYSSGSLKNRAVILGLYSSGLRNSSLRAIRYKDVGEEMDQGLEVIRVPVYPEMKEVDPHACKGNIPYYTFFNAETVETLRRYLADRATIYGDVKDDEPLFCTDDRRVRFEERRHMPLSERGLQDMVKRAAKMAGIKRWNDVSPKCLRVAYESALRNNRLDPKDQEFLMGHILPGSQDAYYDRSKVEELRAKYAQIEFFPQRTASSEDLRRKQVLDTVRLLGFGEERIKRVEEALAKYETVDEAMEEIRKLSLGSGSYVREAETNGGTISYEARIIGEDALVDFVEAGWDIVREMSDGKIVVRCLARSGVILNSI